MLDRVVLGSSLVLASCVPLPQEACSSDTQCSDRFGDDWICGAAGYCAPDEESNGAPMECPTMVCEDVINVGHVSAQTGPTQHLGLGMAVGIRAAFKEVNDAGGVQDRVLNLLVRQVDAQDLEITVTRASGYWRSRCARTGRRRGSCRA